MGEEAKVSKAAQKGDVAAAVTEPPPGTRPRGAVGDVASGELDATMQRLRMTLGHAMADTLHQLEANPSSTLEPVDLLHDSGAQRALETLEKLAAGVGANIEERLRLEGLIGKGGMGLVREAHQPLIGRQVAVKSIRPDVTDKSAALRLLREAWVTGALEHPNVVPVYDIGLDDAGQPLIVLKRIEGQPWSELMRDAEALGRRFGVHDALDWNLRTLQQVLHALAHAHDRGIVHRDIKPENVMIGEHGEVYLVDWGLAVALSDDRGGRLPLAARTTEPAGTPCYMAPEMLGGSPADERTDVYLVGATIYEICTGSAPHRGKNLREIVGCVLRSCPALSDDVPAELAAIIERAMQADPEDRYQSVELLARDLQTFLEQRDAAQLSDLAEQRLAALLAGIAEPEPRRVELYGLLSECRFGFRRVLQSWPQHERAARGLRAATEAMVSYEIDAEDPRAAAALLAELSEPPAELSEKIDTLAREQAARREQLAELASVGQQQDPGIGQRTRLFLALVLGVIWTALPLFAHLFPDKQRSRVGAVVVVALLATGLGLWARESLTKGAFNRKLAVSIMVLVGAQALVVGIGYGLRLSDHAVTVVQLFSWAMVAAMVAATIDPRMWPTTGGYIAAIFVAVYWPSSGYYAMAAGNGFMTINAVTIWRVGVPLTGPPATPKSAEVLAGRERGEGSSSAAR